MHCDRQLRVQRSQGFQVKHGSFTCNGHARVAAPRVRELLKRERRAAREAAKAIVKKPWVIAQLKWRGIVHDRSAGKNTLETVLQDAVARRTEETGPRHLAELEHNLRTQYAPIYQAYKDALSKWQEDQRNAQRQKYDALSSLSAKADFDIELFMQDHFLDASGRPDHAKTPEPLPLPGVTRARVHARGERVPGLRTQSGGSGEGRTLVIGWDSSAVKSKAAPISAEAAAERERAVDTAWAQKMALHHAF